MPSALKKEKKTTSVRKIPKIWVWSGEDSKLKLAYISG
jgi:hypothetical protein